MVMDNRGRSHRPAGLPAQVAGTYDGGERHAGVDLAPPVFDPDERVRSLIDRLPLDPERTLRPPVLHDDDPACRARAALGRHLYRTLAPDADRMQAGREAALTLWPDLTACEPDADSPAGRLLTRLDANGLHPWCMRHRDGRLLIVADSVHKSALHRIDYTFRQDDVRFDQTTLADLLAAAAIRCETGDADPEFVEALLIDDGRDRRRYRLDQGLRDHALDVAHIRRLQGLDDEPPADPTPPALAAWLDAHPIPDLPAADPKDAARLERALAAAEHGRVWAVRSRLAWETPRRLLEGETLTADNNRWRRRRAAGTSATVWMDKKHRDPAHEKAAAASGFARDFTRVEIDDDVDLDRFARLDAEWADYRRLLPQAPAPATLRLRYTGRHRAAGVYHPHAANIAVDPRHPDSFTHEWFHHLDHAGRARPISSDPAFRTLVERYRSTVDRERMSGDPDRWLAPTEILARAGETWMSRHGGDGSSLLKPAAVYAHDWQYAPFLGCEEEIDRLFARRFGEPGA